MRHRCMKSIISGSVCFIISYAVWFAMIKAMWQQPDAKTFSKINAKSAKNGQYVGNTLLKKENSLGLNDLFLDIRNDIRKRRTGRILWYKPPNFQHIIDSERSMEFSTCGFPNSCSHVINPEFINSSDAVIFHGSVLPSVIPKRRKDQFWIFYTLESPKSVYPIRNEWRTQFDWMMTYRRDSDIFLPYGKIFRKQHEENMDLPEIMKGKEKEHPVAWLVSNCNARNGRQQYVNKMNNHVHIDVFGKCGAPLVASFKNTSIEAYKILSLKHKFYLSFENNHCTDYITEKLFNTYSRNVPLVPVVRGGALYNKILPNGTYINAADFKSPKDLADHLSYLNDHDEEYLKILREKLQYDVYNMVEVYHQSLCKICERIQDPSEQVKPNRRDVSSWIRNNTCTTVDDIR
ncbi:Glycoprotein 3-alpha-L-fucosyltransferase A [Mizuhopecten yessoensis]|uniref:Fucosyltransferase n=1 Tax=Mizuhopecten yessoensis TaxID=6573 RepID=A0A210Q6N8_MIZYE|nr:Glycoprotein 3-alpha-L-fucosyltransferase A [Mizuhopecten yessoensis]